MNQTEFPLKSKPRLLFRADGNSQIGLGHVVRCLALAELLAQDFDLTFAIRKPSENLSAQLLQVCQHLVNLPETDYLIEAENLTNELTGQEILVLDGYQFPTKYQKILKQKGNILVCLDDLHDREFVADYIINIAGGIKAVQYKMAPYSQLFSGPEYALLRKPFRDAQKRPAHPQPDQNQMLVCFGGADPENFTMRYVQELQKTNPELPLAVVIGSAYLHKAALQEFISNNPIVTLHHNLTAEEMAALMESCALGLTSASSVSYEYCAVNGMLFLEKTAANQEDLYQYLLAENLALPVSVLEETLQKNSSELAFEFRQKQKQVFNGEAENNLRKLFQGAALQASLQFRQATMEDAELLFAWANDPVVRQFSFSSDPIPWETHVNWLQNKLTQTTALLLIAEAENKPAAFLRFDLNGQEALISYQIGAAFRGKKLGHRVLQLGMQELKKYLPEVEKAIGFVQPQNIASVRAFEKAAFQNLGLDAEKNAFKFQFPLS